MARLRFKKEERKECKKAAERLKIVQQDFLEDSKIERIKSM